MGVIGVIKVLYKDKKTYLYFFLLYYVCGVEMYHLNKER